MQPSNITANLIHNNFTLFLDPVTPDKNVDLLKGLSNSTALDILKLSNKPLKNLGEGIATPLSIIINKCYVAGVFPVTRLVFN